MFSNVQQAGDRADEISVRVVQRGGTDEHVVVAAVGSYEAHLPTDGRLPSQGPGNRSFLPRYAAAVGVVCHPHTSWLMSRVAPSGSCSAMRLAAALANVNLP